MRKGDRVRFNLTLTEGTVVSVNGCEALVEFEHGLQFKLLSDLTIIKAAGAPRKGPFYIELRETRCYYATLEKANKVANEIFNRAGVIVGIFRTEV